MLTPEQRKSLEKDGSFVVPHDYTDFRWLGFHKAFNVKKRDDGKRIITLTEKSYRVIFNKFQGKDNLHVEDKCIQLMPNGRCKIYRNRPQMCRVAECPLFSKSQKIRWYGKNGVLKDWKK